MAPVRIVLGGRERRIVRFGLLGIVMLVVLGRALPTMGTWTNEASVSSREVRTELARAQQLVANHENLARELELSRNLLDSVRRHILPGNTVGEAAGALVAMISRAALSSGVTVNSLRVQDDTASSGIHGRIRVVVTASADVRGTANLLAALERNQTSLRIVRVAISQPQPAALDDQPESLGLQLVIEGLYHRIPGTGYGDDAQPH